LALVALGVMACGGGGDGGAAGGDAGVGEAAAPAAAPAVDPAIAATISGTILLEGTPAPNTVIDMGEEPDCAAKYTDTPPMTEEVVASGGHLANVFVYVKSGLEGTFAPPSTPVTIDQDGCRYHPHVLGIQVGQPLQILNSDPLLHNINTQPTTNRGFNVSQPQAGMKTSRKFRKAEVMIPVKCDVHGWMHAYIGVLDHPYFSVSAGDGSFSIASLPPGTYVVEAWHEKYGTATQTVTVGPSEHTEISFTFSAESAAKANVPLGDPLVLGSEHQDGSRDS